MIVGRNYSYETPTGQWSKVIVSLDWADFCQLVSEKKVQGYRLAVEEHHLSVVDDSGTPIPTLDAYRTLQAYCDILVWTQIASEGGVPPVFARERMRECLDRAPLLRLRS